MLAPPTVAHDEAPKPSAARLASTPRFKRRATAAGRNATEPSHAPVLTNIDTGRANPPVRLIPLQRVCEIVGFRRSAVLDKVARGEIPAPLKFGTSRRAASRWIEQEIIDYVWAKASQRTA
jgi:predicted DNA-binding transcriptional regulator AlpA